MLRASASRLGGLGGASPQAFKKMEREAVRDKIRGPIVWKCAALTFLPVTLVLWSRTW